MLSDIDYALTKAYQDAGLNIPTGYPNMAFTKPVDSIFAEVVNVIGQSSVATLGDTGQDNISGYFQVLFSVPAETGTQDLNVKRELLRTYFRLGRSFTYNNQAVRITYAKLSPVMRNGDYAVGVIQLFWSTFTSRSN